MSSSPPRLGPDAEKFQTFRTRSCSRSNPALITLVDDLPAVVAAGDPAEGGAERLAVDGICKRRGGAACRRGARQDRRDELAVEIGQARPEAARQFDRQ